MRSSNELILFTVSVLPVILIALYVCKKNKKNESKELLVKLFLSGIGSCFLVLIVSFIVGLFFPFIVEDPNKDNLILMLIQVFLGIALIEEMCKWVMVYIFSFNDKNFLKFYDMIIYCVFVALGFACIENLFYVYSGGVGVGISRALLAVPGHACDGVFMGYYLGLSKINYLNNRSSYGNKYLIFSILVPTVVHGIYDYCLFSEKVILLVIFFIFVICVYIYILKKINKISSINRKMRYNDNFCPNCGRVVDGNFCPMCGRKNE